MPSCIVKGCSFSWKKKDPAITIHAFPRSKEMIKAWLMQTGQDFGDIEAFTDKVFEGKKTDAFRICSQHFTPDSYTNEGMRKSLKKDALPTIFNCTVQATTTVKKIQKKKERPPRPKSAKKIRSRMTQRILNITLEIIYLLTGEDYTVVKSRKRAKMRELGELDSSQAPAKMTPLPPCHSSEENSDRRILELAYKIIQLLNGEEGDYLEGHHDFYADMLDNEQSFRSHDLSEHGLVIYTSDNKEESMLYEEGTFMDTSIYTPDVRHSYISTQGEESISQEEGELTDSDITCTLIKEEPPSYHEENLTNKDVWTVTDNMQQVSSSHVKDEDVLHCKSKTLGNDSSAPISHRQQELSTIDDEQPSDQPTIKNESIPCKDGQLNTLYTVKNSEKNYMKQKKAYAKEKVHDSPGEIQYRIVRIKDDSSSEEDNTSTEEYHNDDTDIQEENVVSVNLSQRGGTINNVICSPEEAVRTYQCVGCQKHFTTRTDLQTHQTIHKTFQKSICPECGKTFLCTSALITHRQSHTGEKPFSCNVCGKSFGQLSQLKTHERIHTDERPFSCSVCGKCFRCRSHLISHARIHKEDTVSVV
ncbi:oocyte zinc finger protein XlCOF29-like [Dendropsophus ebraccatus]|uniref:oocyte zinc finger protein XlCOF29-like n=1 Tax=Dendropsophus ebraccatus TaxID=150705 RepID=UPI0038316D3C